MHYFLSFQLDFPDGCKPSLILALQHRSVIINKVLRFIYTGNVKLIGTEFQEFIDFVKRYKIQGVETENIKRLVSESSFPAVKQNSSGSSRELNNYSEEEADMEQVQPKEESAETIPGSSTSSPNPLQHKGEQL